MDPTPAVKIKECTVGPVASIDLIMFLGPDGLKVSSYWKFCVDFKSELLAKPSLGKS